MIKPGSLCLCLFGLVSWTRAFKQAPALPKIRHYKNQMIQKSDYIVHLYNNIQLIYVDTLFLTQRE